MELLALVAPAAPDFCSEDYESLRPSTGQLRVARDFASARRDKRDPLPRIGTGDGAASASKGGDECCVAAQSFAVARCSVDNEVEAATVAGVSATNGSTQFAHADPSLLQGIPVTTTLWLLRFR